MLLFAGAMFLSSFLLFLIEPMVARMILPSLGGAPMVWNGCLVFFQCLLLAGYAWSHGARVWIGEWRSAVAYVLLLLAPLACLPIAVVHPAGSGAAHPWIWLFWMLVASVGAPFFVLATTTSILQQMFSRARGSAGRDPYLLYIASNAGSLLGLLCYPLVVERLLTLSQQGRMWAAGYLVFAVLAAACVFRARPVRRTRPPAFTFYSVVDAPAVVRLTNRRRLRWIALAAIPSSLLLGVTGYITTDIVSFPMIWVVPLALYLVTFMLAFARPAEMRRVADRRLPIGAVAVSVFVLLNVGAPLWLVLPVHLGTFVLAALLCHATLAADRPPARQLSEFYVWLALGGAAGGLLTTLVAPQLFASMAEYPIALVLACLVRAGGDRGTRSPARFFPAVDALVPAGIAVLTVALMLVMRRRGLEPKLAFYLPALLCFSQLRFPRRFALALGALLVVGLASPLGTTFGDVLEARRTFFGVYRVTQYGTGRYYALYHGTTLHGLEAIGAGPHAPLTYFHRDGPFGQAFRAIPSLAASPSVAVVGLGIGALASYAGMNQHWTFYEIDPAVEQFARDARYFSYLAACGDRCDVVIGDARLSLGSAPPGGYGLIVLDAFSSDSIPVHLVTSEAIGLYLSRLSSNGVLAFHISNRYLELGPMLARLAGQHGLSVLEERDAHTEDVDAEGMTTSDWVVMARRPEDLGTLVTDPRWIAPRVLSSTPLWTDDFSNILSVFRMSG